MLIHLGNPFDGNYIGMQNRYLLLQFERDRNIGFLDILV